jgi:hypothetical protein
MKKPKIGDLIEIKASEGVAYAIYTHSHKQFGDLLRVYHRVYDNRPTEFDSLLQSSADFSCFFPLRAAVSKGIVNIVGNFPISENMRIFPVFRDGIFDSSAGRVNNWWLWDGEREWQVGVLTENQKKFPIRELVNDTLLVERIESHWVPEKDV